MFERHFDKSLPILENKADLLKIMRRLLKEFDSYEFNHEYHE